MERERHQNDSLADGYEDDNRRQAFFDYAKAWAKYAGGDFEFVSALMAFSFPGCARAFAFSP